MDRLLHLLFNHFRPLAAIARAGKARYGQPPPKRLSLWQYLFYGLLITSAPRFLFVGVALKRGKMDALETWEPITFHSVSTFFILSGNLMLCAALLPVYAFYIQYLYDFKVRRIYAALQVADLFVVNCRGLLKRNPELMPRFRLGSLLQSLKITVGNFRAVWAGVHDKTIYLEALTLEHFPGLSKRIRVQAALLALLFEVLSVVMMAGVVIAGGVLCVQFLFGPNGFLFQRHSPLVYFRFVVETFTLMYGAVVAIFLVFYGTLSIYLIKFTYKHQLKELGEQLQASLAKVSHWEMTPSTYAVHVERYRRQHSTIWRNVHLLKVQLVDSCMLVLFLTNVSLNVFLVSQILFQRRLPLTEKAVAIFGFTFQTALGVSGGTMFANFAAMLYTSARYLHRTTLFLVGPSRLPDKVKMMAYYEVVHSSTNRLCFSIGSLFKIEKEAFLSYAFMYTGYVLYVSKLVRKSSAKE